MEKRKLGLIFTGIAMVGTVVTNVVTGMRTLKYKQILEECEENKPKAFVKTYWPSMVLGAATMTSIALAEKANLAEIGVLTGACGYLASKAKGLEEAVKKSMTSVDEEKQAEVQKEVVKYVKMPGPSVEETGRGDVLCLEDYSGRWFRSSEESVRRAVREFKKMYDEGKYVCFNDLYILLGIVDTQFGFDWGYPSGNPDYCDEEMDIEVDWYTELECPMGMNYYGEPILVIKVHNPAMECWQEL